MTPAQAAAKETRAYRAARETFPPFVAVPSKMREFFGALVIQLVWYILKQLFASVSVKVMDIYRFAAR